MWREQTEQGRVLATQDDHAPMFRALGSIRLKARELHSRVRRLLVVAREQHNEVSRVLNGLVHLLDEVRCKGNVVVLNKDLVALLRENVGHLLRNSRHRAATAQEEVIARAGITSHRGSFVPTGGGHVQVPCVKDASYRRSMMIIYCRENNRVCPLPN